MKRKGYTGRSREHSLNARGIRTKGLQSRGEEEYIEYFDVLYEYIHSRGIEMMPEETMDWYENIIGDNKPNYFFYTDYGEKTFQKVGIPFTQEEMNKIEELLKKGYENENY